MTSGVKAPSDTYARVIPPLTDITSSDKSDRCGSCWGPDDPVLLLDLLKDPLKVFV